MAARLNGASPHRNAFASLIVHIAWFTPVLPNGKAAPHGASANWRRGPRIRSSVLCSSGVWLAKINPDPSIAGLGIYPVHIVHAC